MKHGCTDQGHLLRDGQTRNDRLHQSRMISVGVHALHLNPVHSSFVCPAMPLTSFFASALRVSKNYAHPKAERQGWFCYWADGTIAERMNGERTETFLPGIHWADYILRQLSVMSFPKWSLFTRFDVHLAAVPLPLPTVIHVWLSLHPAIQPFSSITIFFRLIISALYSWGIIFLRSYLGFVKLQGVSYEQSSFGQILLKEYSSRQSCLICPIRTSESRKIFPQHSRKALIKGK